MCIAIRERRLACESEPVNSDPAKPPALMAVAALIAALIRKPIGWPATSGGSCPRTVPAATGPGSAAHG